MNVTTAGRIPAPGVPMCERSPLACSIFSEWVSLIGLLIATPHCGDTGDFIGHPVRQNQNEGTLRHLSYHRGPGCHLVSETYGEWSSETGFHSLLYHGNAYYWGGFLRSVQGACNREWFQ